MEPKHWRCSQCRLGTLNTLLACLLACSVAGWQGLVLLCVKSQQGSWRAQPSDSTLPFLPHL